MNSNTKIRTPEEAIALLPSGGTLAVSGVGSVQEPDLLFSALIDQFRKSGSPRDITEIHVFRTGDAEGRGTSLLCEPGLVRRIIGGSFWPGGVIQLVRDINACKIEAYNFPAGAVYGMLEATAAGRPGVVTPLGLGTFADPRQSGGSLNAISKDTFVSLIEINGQEYLFYQAIPIDTAFIRGTVADTLGNLSLEEEPAICGPLVTAQAAKASGGKVIAQVKRVVPAGELDPRQVRVPGYLVDALVVHPGQMQTMHSVYDPTLVGQESFDPSSLRLPEKQSSRAVLHRAMEEVRDGDAIIIGIGLPTYLPIIALEQGRYDKLTFTIEHGVNGGINGFLTTRTFPVQHSPQAIVDAYDQLRMYAGGALDCAFLGIGELDVQGNINVCRFGERIPGAGGMTDIVQGTPRLVFCSTADEKDRRKFVPQVCEVTFNGKRALEAGQQVTYVTNRAVLSLCESGFVLQEVAPGLDIRRDVLDWFGLPITVPDTVKTMQEAYFV